MIGENKPGGVALVISVTGAATASSMLSGVCYDVKYVVGNRVERNISDNLVTSWSHERRPRRASVAASASFARAAAPASHNDEAAAATAKFRVSEEKTRQLEAIIEKQQTEFRVVASTNKVQRSEITALKNDLKGAQVQTEALIAENAAIKYHAERAFLDQAAAAAIEASRTAQAESRAKLTAAKRAQSEAEWQARDEKAARMRTESNAGQLVSDQAATLQRVESLLVSAEAKFVGEMDSRIDTEVENAALQMQVKRMQAACDRVTQEKDRLLTEKANRAAKQRALSRNTSRTRRRAEKRQQNAIEAAKASASAIIKVRHGDGPRSHATARAWLAQLKQLDAGRIASNNSAAVVNSFDAWSEGGGSFNLRPLSRSSVNRKLRKRFYLQKILESDEISKLIATGIVGLQLSADASSMLGYELLAAALYASGCFFSSDNIGLDGLPRMAIFLHKYVCPMLSIESKTGKHLAWCLTQHLIFFGLLPKGCPVEDVSKSLTKHFYHYFSDIGAENTGGWRAAYLHGVGGAFKLLFTVEEEDGAHGRIALYNSCTVHDLHNFYAATQLTCKAVPNIHATIRSASKYINLGSRHKVLLPLCEYLAKITNECPIKNDAGARVAEEARAELADNWARPSNVSDKELSRLIGSRHKKPGETRFASDGDASKQLSISGPVLAYATIVSQGAKTTLADCKTALRTMPKGRRKAATFVSQMTPWENRVFLALVRLRHELFVAPLMAACERGSHASAPIVSGPYGEFRRYRRMIERSIIRLPVKSHKLDEPITVRSAGGVLSQKPLRRAWGAELQLRGKAVLLPRFSVWKAVLLMATSTPQRVFIVHNIVHWVAQQLSEYDRRLNRQWTRIEALVAAGCREYTWTAQENSPLLYDADDASAEPVAPSWAVQRDLSWGPFRRSREAHAELRSATEPEARVDAISRRRKALGKSFEDTCFAPLLEDTSADIQLRALYPLEIGDYEMPTFPTKLELTAMKQACHEFDRLNDTAAGVVERREYRWHLRELLECGKPFRVALDGFCNQSALMEDTQQLKPLRTWPALCHHLYAYFALEKKTAIDNEHLFSVTKCWVLSVSHTLCCAFARARVHLKLQQTPLHQSYSITGALLYHHRANRDRDLS